MAIAGAIPGPWLLDAPLFIDEQQIKSLYNAVALPEYEDDPSVTISTKNVKVVKWGAGGEVKASVGGDLWKLFFPISGEATVKGDVGQDKTDETQQEWQLHRVSTPERRLTNLAVFYAANLPDRVWTVDGLDDSGWPSQPASGGDTPKPLVFLDVKPGFPIIPMAAELSEGKVVTFYDRIAAAINGPGQTLPPEYPNQDVENLMPLYWTWFHDEKPNGGDTSLLLMNIVEEAIGAYGRPRWIDCRVPLGPARTQTKSLHLHIKGREKYDTGDFAYGFIRRGKRHGYRVIGILKEGPGLNVLAIYEK
jgi:hypothetical protein